MSEGPPFHAIDRPSRFCHYDNMNRVIALHKHKQLPTDHFGQAASLIEQQKVLLPCPSSYGDGMEDGYRIEAINRTFEEGGRPYGMGEAEMFVAIFDLMRQVQEETAGRETTEARDRLLAIATGLSDKALDAIRDVDLHGWPRSRIPPDAVLRFTCFADDKRRNLKARSNYGEERLHSADILTLPAKDL